MVASIGASSLYFGGSLPEVTSQIPRHAPACRGLTPDLAPAVPHDGAARCVPTSSWPQGTVQSRVSLNPSEWFFLAQYY